MGNNIVCSRCGSANVRCEAMVNPNTKGFDHFTDEAFYYGWCENCGLGGALTDKEEIRNEILEKYHRFKKENACDATLRELPDCPKGQRSGQGCKNYAFTGHRYGR